MLQVRFFLLVAKTWEAVLWVFNVIMMGTGLRFTSVTVTTSTSKHVNYTRTYSTCSLTLGLSLSLKPRPRPTVDLWTAPCLTRTCSRRHPSLLFRVNMAASMASQAAARGLRTATSKHILLDKLKVLSPVTLPATHFPPVTGQFRCRLSVAVVSGSR